MASLNFNVGGTWKPARNVSVHVGGVWTGARIVWVNSGGVWKQVWSALITFEKGVVSGANSTWTKNSSYIDMYAYDATNGGGESMLVSSQAWMLTAGKALQVDWSHNSNTVNQEDAILCIVPEANGKYGGWSQLTNFGAVFSRRTDTLTVSTTGRYYIQVMASVNGGIRNWSEVLLYRILYDGAVLWDASVPAQTL